MKIFIALAVFFLCCTLTRCVFSNCEKIDLKKEDLEKLDMYKDLNYLVFKSDSSNVDTLTVTDNSLCYSPCNKFELSDYQFQNRNISFKNSGWHGDTYSWISFSLDNEYNEDSTAVFYLHVHCAMCKYEDYISIDTIVNKFRSNPIICKKFSWDGSAGSGKNEEITYFYWSDDIGLVRYTTHSGEVYDLFYSHYKKPKRR